MIDGRDEHGARRIDEPPSEVEDDPTRATEEAEPYFPPTDPVVDADAEVVGGFEQTSMTDDPRQPPRTQTGEIADEALADRVRRELRQDAATADLALDVGVEEGVATLRGTVRDAADVDNALEVAGRVNGVADVVDELEITGS